MSVPNNLYLSYIFMKYENYDFKLLSRSRGVVARQLRVHSCIP